MRYLVTGGTSFLGAPLVQRLLDAKHDVIVLSRNPDDQRLRGRASRVVHCDIRDAAAVAGYARGCDSVIHLAYAKPWAADLGVLNVAVSGMFSVLSACEQQGIRELMLVSSPLAADARCGNGNAYGSGKMISEIMAETWMQAGVLDRVIIARPYNVYGPDGGYHHVIPQFITRMRQLIASGQPDPLPFLVTGTGTETRAFVYIDDCTDQLYALLGDISPPGLSVRDVGTLGERSITSVARSVASCFGREIRVVPSPIASGPEPRRIPLSAVLPPKISFPEGLARTVAWYQEQAMEAAYGQR